MKLIHLLSDTTHIFRIISDFCALYSTNPNMPITKERRLYCKLTNNTLQQ